APSTTDLSTLSLHDALPIYTLAVAAGLAAVFAASETAFLVVKLAGAGYLLYLAWGALRSGASATNGPRAPRMSGGQLYRRGVIMSLTNPKVTVFFLADRKSTRLNSSHVKISYAVFCLKK